MSLGRGHSSGMQNCMISQTSKALELGATAEELLETCSVVVSMGGTLAWSNSLVVAGYLREREIIT
jgi:alkylhydroperoxidase/carboxymuconolactone decarboxylase family protein YurZ